MTQITANEKQLQLYRMHSGFNRFVIVDGRNQITVRQDAMNFLLAQAATLDRATTFDQLLYLEHSEQATCKVSIYNTDGSRSGMCANGLRCVAKLLPSNAVLEVDNRLYKTKSVYTRDLQHQLFCVNIGQPRTKWNEIPLAKPMSTPVLEKYSYKQFKRPVVVNVGNPHIVFFLTDLDINDLDIAEAGAEIEADPLFPERINVSFAQILSESTIRAKVWERGVGQTQSCGSAACAIAWAANFIGKISRSAEIFFGPASQVDVSILDDGSLESVAEAVLLSQDVYPIMTENASKQV